MSDQAVHVLAFIVFAVVVEFAAMIITSGHPWYAPRRIVRGMLVALAFGVARFLK